MQQIVLDIPYHFVPPYKGTGWLWFFRRYVPWSVRTDFGIEAIEWHGLEHLRASLAAGHGIILAANHCRPCDPPMVGLTESQTGAPCFLMASWHLFKQGWLKAWLLRRVGAFSIYREGVDREALKAAIDIVVEAKRPLILFPEGIVSRTNDRLGVLQDGTAFIARSAAKQRGQQSPAAKVVVHPIALRYWFQGDFHKSVEPVLRKIETRLSWQPRSHWPMRERICAIGEGLLCLKEIEYLGKTCGGALGERLERLLEGMLQPLENEWLHGAHAAHGAIERVKRLRGLILPDMVANRVTPEERARRWRQLTDLYYVQQLSCYPPDYLDGEPSVERVLETIERFEEDLFDVATIHRPMKVLLQIGPALEVSATRERRGERDPLMQALEEQLHTMLTASARVTTSPSPFVRQKS